MNAGPATTDIAAHAVGIGAADEPKGQEMTNPDELERLARAATPGPWTWDDPQSCASGLSGPSGTPVIEDLGYDGLWIVPYSPNAAFIASANPATILDLLAANRKMREALERLASSEAFDMPQAIDGPLAEEIRMRLDYARSALSTKEQPADGCSSNEGAASILPQTEKGS